MVQGLEYTIHRKEKIQFAGKQKYSKKTDVLVVKKKDQKNKPHFLPFQNGKKNHHF